MQHLCFFIPRSLWSSPLFHRTINKLLQAFSEQPMFQTVPVNAVLFYVTAGICGNGF